MEYASDSLARETSDFKYISVISVGVQQETDALVKMG